MSSDAGKRERSPWHVSWELMNARAWWLLEDSGAREPPPPGLPRLRLWDDAMTFGCGAEPTTWMVFVPTDAGQPGPVVREAVWGRGADLRRLRDLVQRYERTVTFEPTITVRDAVVPGPELRAFLWEGASFQLPLVWLTPKRAITDDVGEQGFDFFSLDSPPAVLSVSWSVDRPAEWEPVVAWVGRLRRFLQGYLADAGPSDEI